MVTMTKVNLKHIASVLMAQAENLKYDDEYCNRHEVYNAIGSELAINFSLELLVSGMRDIKQDNFDIGYVESVQTALRAMSDFLVEEMEARAREVIIEELVWDTIDHS